MKAQTMQLLCEGLIVMKARVTVLAVEKKEWPAKENFAASTQFVCQCLVHGEKQLVGVLKIDSRNVEGDILPGDYMADFGIKVDYKTKDIQSRVVEFVRIAPGALAAAAPESIDKETGELKPAKK